jgi:hypothetical protein
VIEAGAKIKETVRNYWQNYTNRIADSLTKEFFQYVQETGLKIGNGIDRVKLPNFRNLKLKLIPGDFSIEDNNLVKKLLGDNALNFECLLKKKSNDPYLFLRDGGIFPILMKARDRAIRQHKEFREHRNGLLSELKKHKKNLPKHSPPENLAIYQEAIDRLEYLHKFSTALIDYLENEWVETFGLARNTDKDLSKHPCWNPILINTYYVLTKETAPPFQHTAACEFIAGILGLVYPEIWGGDEKKIASRIRNKIDTLNPFLVNK